MKPRNPREEMRFRNEFVVCLATACLKEEVDFNMTLLLLVKEAALKRLKELGDADGLTAYQMEEFCRVHVSRFAEQARRTYLGERQLA